MTKRIFRSIILVSLITFVSCMVLVMGVLHGYFNNRLTDELKSETAYLAAGIVTGGMEYLENTDSDNRITWIDSNGDVLYDSKKDTSKLENHSDREEVSQALKNGEGTSRRYSKTLSEQNVYYAKLLTDGTVIRVSSVQYTLWVVLLSVINPMLAILVLVLILSVVLAVAMSKKIVKPINDINIENPDIDEDYAELSPLLHKINRQNKLIQRQMNDLRCRQEEFRTITENMSEGLVLIDNKAEVLSYNASALKLLGASDTPFGTSVFTLNRSREFWNAVIEALKGNHSEPEFSIGERRYQLFANPVTVKQKVSGAVLVILDVTEKEQREAMRREFTSNVSHELKTPLTSIYGISEIMMNGIVKPEDMRGFAKSIYEETGRLIELVNDILKLSRLDEGGDNEERTDVDLYRIATDVVSRLERVAENADVSLKLEGEHAVINGSPSVLNEMLYNLCDNGIKYNKKGGSVTVETGGGDRPFFKVSDTGVGIPKEHQDRVFERFYRGDKCHSSQISGTGLGLSIVKHGAAFHNAELKMESTVGVGTSVTVTFPGKNN